MEFWKMVIAQAPTFVGLIAAIVILQMQVNRLWSKIDEQDAVINQMREENGQGSKS